MLNVEVDLDKDFISIYVFIAAYFPKGLLFVIPLFYSISVSKFNQFLSFNYKMYNSMVCVMFLFLLKVVGDHGTAN